MSKEKGFSAIFITILALVIVLGVVLSFVTLTLGEQKISGNITKSNQAYYLSEAGLEDILLRLAKGKNWSTPSNLSLAGGTATVETSNIIGGSRTITSTANIANRVRKIQVVYQISSDAISFHYGAQVGAGGMIMGNGSAVQGNVFSNGNVTGGGTIANSIIVASNGNKIEDLTVGEDAMVHTCKNSTIGGTLTYVSGGSVTNCTVGETIQSQPSQIEPISLPISQSQIDEWKVEAAAGGVNTNNVTISGTQSLGPIQIGTAAAPRNLTVDGGATLKVTGTIYVTGNIIFNNNSKIQLDNSYGSLSGIVLSDGVVTVNNNTIISGSGQAGSYILVLSTKNDTVNPVIDVRNNSAGAVFYTNSGLISLNNNMTAREVTGYKIQLNNNAVIQYESGLASLMFSSGPGGSWQVASWKEIE